MIKKKMTDALNKQINEELYSAYLYMAMSAWFSDKNLDGFANWMYVQALEEFTHAQRIYNFVLERGGRVKLAALDGPPADFDGPTSIFEAALKHEQHITDCIDKLVDISIKEKDHATGQMLQWFVNEQVEEEASADEILQKLNLVGEKGNALYMLDKEMAARQFVPPVAEGE